MNLSSTLADARSALIGIAIGAVLVLLVMSQLDGCQRDETAQRAREATRADDALLRAIEATTTRIEALEARQPEEAAATAAAAEATARALVPVAALSDQVRQLAADVRAGDRRHSAPLPRAGDGQSPEAVDPTPCTELADACTALADSAEVALDAYARQVSAQADELATCSALSDALRTERDLYRARAETLRPVVDQVARTGADTGPGLYVGFGQTHIPPQFVIPYEPQARRIDAAVTVAAPLGLRLPLVGSIPLAGVATLSRSCQSASLTLGL